MHRRATAIFDLIVVGAGPAGLATAIAAQLRGLRAVVLDARRGPIDKACGEGIMPRGVQALDRLGVELNTARAFRGIRYIDGDIRVEADFRTGPGLGVRRTELSRAMQRRAEELDVDLRTGCRVRAWRHDRGTALVDTDDGTVAGGLLVAADGLHSPIRRSAGLDRPWHGRPRYGLRQHLRMAPWSDRVEVYWADGIEAYVTPVADNEVGIALLWDGSGGDFDSLLARFPSLVQHTAGAAAASRARGAGPLGQAVVRRWAPGLALVGDAAGYLDAITGEGISLALDAAQTLTRTIAAGGTLAAYDRACTRATRRYYLLTSALLAVARRPALRRALIRTLAAAPWLFEAGLAINAGGLLRLRRPLLPAQPRQAAPGPAACDQP